MNHEVNFTDEMMHIEVRESVYFPCTFSPDISASEHLPVHNFPSFLHGAGYFPFHYHHPPFII